MIIDQWGKGEEKALRASSGQWTQQNGHVHTLINPELRYFGFGYVKGSDGWFTGAGFGSNSPITSDNLCLLYTSPSPRDRQKSRMPSSA